MCEKKKRGGGRKEASQTSRLSSRRPCELEIMFLPILSWPKINSNHKNSNRFSTRSHPGCKPCHKNLSYIKDIPSIDLRDISVEIPHRIWISAGAYVLHIYLAPSRDENELLFDKWEETLYKLRSPLLNAIRLSWWESFDKLASKNWKSGFPMSKRSISHESNLQNFPHTNIKNLIS